MKVQNAKSHLLADPICGIIKKDSTKDEEYGQDNIEHTQSYDFLRWA